MVKTLKLKFIKIKILQSQLHTFKLISKIIQMKKYFSKSAFLLCLIISTNVYSQWKYPETRKVDSAQTYFGVTLKDPYQWIEDLKSTEVQSWFKAQSEFTDNALSKIPGQDILFNEMTQLDNVKNVKYSSIQEVKGKYFFEKRLPGEEENKLYFRNDKYGEDILLFDPVNYIPGTSYNLSGWSLNEHGNKVIIGITESGKERPFLKIMDVETKTFYPEEFKASYSSGWVDGAENTFMYLKLKNDDVHDPSSNLDSKLMIHTLGKSVSADKEILSRVHDPSLDIKPEEYPYILISPDNKYLFAYKSSVDNNQEIYFANRDELFNEKINWKKLCSKEDKITSAINFEDDIYFLTSKNSSNFKIIKTSLINPDVNNAEIIMEGTDKKIDYINSARDYLIITLVKNGIETFVNKMDFRTGKIVSVDMPLSGSISVIPNSIYSNECTVWNSYWTTPSNLYQLNLENNEFEKGPFNVVANYPGIENLVSAEIEVPSHDGVMVPLSIVYDKTLFKNDGSNICYLDGYGAYGYPSSPYFDYSMLTLYKRGVIFAVAHVRGGGEKGEEWYRAGWKTTKPNTWKDFIACGEYLIKNNYTSSVKLAGTGTSAGGILIGRAITERPDLFKVAIPKVGCMNTVRAELSPNGPINIPEFGTVTVEEDFKALYEMDSYHHLKEGTHYPSTLITTGFNDPRVISWIPGKFAAKMQEVNSSDNPVLIKVDYTTGHFGGESMSSYFRNTSEIFSFILWQCGHPDFQLKDN